jgi:hypothetical protein
MMSLPRSRTRSLRYCSNPLTLFCDLTQNLNPSKETMRHRSWLRSFDGGTEEKVIWGGR